MNLGLLDILTVQQAQKPDYGVEPKGQHSAVSDAEKPFKDYLDNTKDKIDEVVSGDNSPVYDNINYSNINAAAEDISKGIKDIVTNEVEGEGATNIFDSIIALIPSKGDVVDPAEA